MRQLLAYVTRTACAIQMSRHCAERGQFLVKRRKRGGGGGGRRKKPDAPGAEGDDTDAGLGDDAADKAGERTSPYDRVAWSSPLSVATKTAS